MSGSNITFPSKQGMSTLVRPKFAPGMLLQHEDLDQLSAYTRELNRLMFRSLFGCGVICGLVVKPEQNCGQDCITIGAGLGLDCAGDPIHVPRDQRIVLDENCVPNPNDVLWVVLCAKIKCCAPRTPMCPSDEGEPESMCTREREAFEIRVVPERPKCACSCVPEDEAAADGNVDEGQRNVVRADKESDCYCVDPTLPCYADHYAGKCGCDCDDCGGAVCCCDCVILARLDKVDDDGNVSWTADHSVRRFIRPVLMRDPQAFAEKAARHQSSAAIQAKYAAMQTLEKTATKQAKASKTVKG
jgi:hypothetical protein